jgi:ParB family chromosome partitioning protein
MSDTKQRQVVQLKLTDLQPADDNPRTNLGDLDGLAASMRELGVLEPLLVVPEPGQPGRWRIVAGHRRHAAAKVAGLDTVPCIVREALDDKGRRQAMLIENLQRRDLDPLEEARGFQLLTVNHRMSQRKVADTVGVNQSHVSKRLKLLTLPYVAHDMLADGRITVEEAVDLARCDDPAKLIDGADLTVPRDHYMSVQWLVNEELAAKAAAAKKARRVRELEADGIRVHDGPAGWPQDLRGDGDTRTVRLFNLDRYRQVDVDAHDGEPCHAIAIGDDVEFPVCTDPSRHPKLERGREREQLQLEHQEATRQREAASELRRQVAGQVFTGLVVTGEVDSRWVLELLCLVIVSEPNLVAGNQAAIGRMLGETWESSWRIDGPLQDHAAQGTEELVTAALATALVDLDWGPHAPAQLTPARRAFLQLLVEHGYEPTADEARLLAGDADAEAA